MGTAHGGRSAAMIAGSEREGIVDRRLRRAQAGRERRQQGVGAAGGSGDFAGIGGRGDECGAESKFFERELTGRTLG